MGDPVAWNRIKLEEAPAVDGGGFFLVEGTRYGSLSACGKYLGTTKKKVKEAWRASIPRADEKGFIYLPKDVRKRKYFTWRGQKFLPFELMKFLVKGPKMDRLQIEWVTYGTPSDHEDGAYDGRPTVVVEFAEFLHL